MPDAPAAKAGLFLQQGDEVVLTIGNLGTLRTPIVRDSEP